MGLTRAYIVKGPAKIVLGGISYWTPDDISLDLDDGIVDVLDAADLMGGGLYETGSYLPSPSAAARRKSII
jgi:hypothetical protein